MENKAYKWAREFVEEQSMGEWGEEAVAKDARLLAATMECYANELLVHHVPPQPRIVCVVPVGWSLMPNMASADMLRAGAAENTDEGQEQSIYQAMRAAAPESPLPAVGPFDAQMLPEAEGLGRLVGELKRADIADSREKLADICRRAAQAIQMQQAAIRLSRGAMSMMEQSDAA